MFDREVPKQNGSNRENNIYYYKLNYSFVCTLKSNMFASQRFIQLGESDTSLSSLAICIAVVNACGRVLSDFVLLVYSAYK